MRPVPSTHLLAVLVLLFGACHHYLFAQSLPCPTGEALLSANDPMYPDAMEFKRDLQNHGVNVKCIFPTKLGSIFMVEENGVLRSTIEGEACFHTDHGDIDAIFVPKPQTFADFKIKEHREGGGYVYRFSGTPKVHGGNKFKFGTARRDYFIKHENQLLMVGDNQMLARLEEILHLSPTTP